MDYEVESPRRRIADSPILETKRRTKFLVRVARNRSVRWKRGEAVYDENAARKNGTRFSTRGTQTR